MEKEAGTNEERVTKYKNGKKKCKKKIHTFFTLFSNFIDEHNTNHNKEHFCKSKHLKMV